MHVLRATKPIHMGRDKVLEAGEWLMHDQNAFECAMLADRGTTTLSTFPNRTSLLLEKTTVADLTIIRSGAIGDLLLASPAIKAFKETTGTKINLSCFPERAQLFDHTDLFSNILPYPLPFDTSQRINLLSLENVIETNNTDHATDAFAKALGVTVTDYKPIYVVTPEEKRDALFDLPKGRPFVGIQPRSTARNRDYPDDQWQEVIAALDKRGWHVILFGSFGQIPALPPSLERNLHVTNLAMERRTFRQAAAFLANCDAFCGVDSAFLHLCHALDIPAVGLFGAFSWKTRTSKAPKTIALTGAGDCAGCSWLPRNGRHFPPDMPCSVKQQCQVLADIKPSTIVAKLDAMKP